MKMDQISNFKKSIPDGERFLQEPLSQYSYWRANAYIGGQNPLTWEGIYQVALLLVGLSMLVTC